MTNYKNIDDYIQQFPADIQEILNIFRRTIKQSAPDAVEKISYQMPTFYYLGNLVHFAVSSNHFGFYPSPSGIENFKDELQNYKYSKGAIQFPKDKELPIELIKKIVEFRVKENEQKAISIKKKI